MAARIPLTCDRLRRRLAGTAPVAAPARAAHERPHGHRPLAGQRARAAAVPAQRAAPLVHADGRNHARGDVRLVGRSAALRLSSSTRAGASGCWWLDRPSPGSGSGRWPSRTRSPRRSRASLVGSLGVAAFHPEASKYAAWLSGDRRSTAMSVFSVGGNLGVAVGPLLAGLIASQFGLAGVWLLAIPGVVDRDRPARRPRGAGRSDGARRASVPRSQGAIAGGDRTPAGRARRCAATSTSACSRSFRCSSTTRATTASAYGSRVLALMLFAGALGTLAAGPLADRYGRRRVLTLTFLAGRAGRRAVPREPGRGRTRRDRTRRSRA